MARQWHKHEVDLLINNIQLKTNRELSALIGFSESAIKRQIKKLGLKREFGADINNSLSTTDKAYLAGHFDGEGCIRLRKHPRGNIYSIYISSVGNHFSVIERYQNSFGGTVKTRAKENRKTLFVWELKNVSKSIFFLASVLPYLMEKKPQAEIALEYLEKRIKQSVSHPSDKLREFSKLCSEKITQLKK